MKSFIDDTISLTPAAWWETWGDKVIWVLVIISWGLLIGVLIRYLVKKWNISEKDWKYIDSRITAS